jgi:hypothetical protein
LTGAPKTTKVGRAIMFVWDETEPQRAVRRAQGARREHMYRREIEERAALLYRLGFTAKQCKSRLQASVAWDFELHGRPKHAGEIDKIVDAVYRRGGGSGPPTV